MGVGLRRHAGDHRGRPGVGGRIVVDRAWIGGIAVAGRRQAPFGQDDRLQRAAREFGVVGEQAVQGLGLVGVDAPEVDVRTARHPGRRLARNVRIVVGRHADQLVGRRLLHDRGHRLDLAPPEPGQGGIVVADRTAVLLVLEGEAQHARMPADGLRRLAQHIGPVILLGLRRLLVFGLPQHAGGQRNADQDGLACAPAEIEELPVREEVALVPGIGKAAVRLELPRQHAVDAERIDAEVLQLRPVALPQGVPAGNLIEAVPVPVADGGREAVRSADRRRRIAHALQPDRKGRTTGLFAEKRRLPARIDRAGPFREFPGVARPLGPADTREERAGQRREGEQSASKHLSGHHG